VRVTIHFYEYIVCIQRGILTQSLQAGADLNPGWPGIGVGFNLENFFMRQEV
jgi:hypothetical protein